MDIDARKAWVVGTDIGGTFTDIIGINLVTGDRGEIRARGPQIMSGYCNRPAETAEGLREGWLYTGDIGELDAEGWLYIRDRKKDMAIVGGYNVYPREVDEVLFAHPEVKEAACAGVPDPYYGEAIRAYVVLKPGARERRGPPRALPGEPRALQGAEKDLLRGRAAAHDGREDRPNRAPPAARSGGLDCRLRANEDERRDAMKVNKIDHICVAVRNLEEARKVWEPVLGKSGPDDAYVDEPEKIRVARYWLGEVGFELMESTTPDGEVAKFIAKRGEGVMLISFNVDSTRQSMDELKGKGYSFIGGARPFRDCEFAFLPPKTMNGVLLELIDYKWRELAERKP